MTVFNVATDKTNVVIPKDVLQSILNFVANAPHEGKAESDFQYKVHEDTLSRRHEVVIRIGTSVGTYLWYD